MNLNNYTLKAQEAMQNAIQIVQKWPAKHRKSAYFKRHTPKR
jgi:hypothetical protein